MTLDVSAFQHLKGLLRVGLVVRRLDERLQNLEGKLPGIALQPLLRAGADAVVAGDVAMLDAEVTPVLKALRANGIFKISSRGAGQFTFAQLFGGG